MPPRLLPGIAKFKLQTCSWDLSEQGSLQRAWRKVTPANYPTLGLPRLANPSNNPGSGRLPRPVLPWCLLRSRWTSSIPIQHQLSFLLSSSTFLIETVRPPRHLLGRIFKYIHGHNPILSARPSLPAFDRSVNQSTCTGSAWLSFPVEPRGSARRGPHI